VNHCVDIMSLNHVVTMNVAFGSMLTQASYITVISVNGVTLWMSHAVDLPQEPKPNFKSNQLQSEIPGNHNVASGTATEWCCRIGNAVTVVLVLQCNPANHAQ